MKLSTKIRIIIFALIGGFCALCLCFFPEGTRYIADFASSSGIEIPQAAVAAIGALLCAPCIVLLVLAMKLADAVERDEVFTEATARRLSLISLIFLCDCILFLAGIAVMLLFGERLLAPIFALVDLIGLGIAMLLRILAGYIRRAAELKEEVEGTL